MILDIKGRSNNQRICCAFGASHRDSWHLKIPFVLRDCISHLLHLSIHCIVYTATHAPNNFPIPFIAYFINTLDSQSSGRGKVGQTFSKLGTFLPHSVPIFEKKNLIRYVLWKVIKKIKIIKIMHKVVDHKWRIQ